MSNRVNLTLDVTKTGIQNPLIKVRQGDGGFETLRTTVTSNGEPLDLQGWIITFMGTTAGSHKIVDDNVTVVEAPNGIFDYTPSKAWGMDIGEFKIAYFKFVKGDGTASSANFRVNVIEAVDLTQEEAQNYISVVDATITEAREHLENSLADVTASVAATSSAVGSLSVSVSSTASSAVSQINSAASNASSVATSAVNNVSSVASSAVDNINGAADVYVKKSGSETIDGDKTFVRPINGSLSTRNATFTDFNDVARNVVKYSGSWVVASQSIANSPLQNYYTAIITPGSTGGTDGYIELVPFAGGLSKKYIAVVGSGTLSAWKSFAFDDSVVHKTGTETIAGDKTFTSPINGQLSGNAATATKWQTARTLALTGDVTGSVAVDGSGNVSMATTGANLVHKTGTETISGDKTFTGVSTLTNIKSSSVKTASVALGGMTINFRQTIAGVNVYISGSFQTNFGPSDDYIANSNGVPSSIGSPRQNVVLTIIGNSGISGVTSNAPFKLEVLIGTDGTIKYRAKNLLVNDTASHNVAIIGAASTFYSLD